MGTTPRTTPKKRIKIGQSAKAAPLNEPAPTAVPRSLDTVPALDAAAITVATDPVVIKLMSLQETTKPTVAQEVLVAARSIWQVSKHLDALKKKITPILYALRSSGASFEQGTVMGEATLQFNETMKASPQYKDVAVEYAKKVAELEGREFSQDAFDADIAKRYPKKPSQGLSFS